MTNSRNLTDAEAIALLERTGAHWEITHNLTGPRWRHLRQPERYWHVSLMIETRADDSDGTIFPDGYSNWSMGRAAIRCVIKAMRELAKLEAGDGRA